MTILHRYIIKEIVKQLSLILIAVVFIYVVVDFFERADKFIKSDLSPLTTLTYFLLNIPFIISQLLPIGMLLAVVIVFSIMTKNNEIMALRTSGVSYANLLRPVLVLGAIASLGLFFFTDIIVPITSLRASQIWMEEIKGRSLIRARERNIWIKGHRKITHFSYYDPARQTAHGIAINFFDKNFKLIRKLDAEKAVFTNQAWHCFETVEQVYNATTDTYDILFHAEQAVTLEFIPQDLKQVVRKPSEMGFRDLLAYIRKVEKEGYDATAQWVDLYAKPAYAFVCLLMGVLGAGIALRQRHNQGIFIGIAYGMLGAFLFWIFYSFSLSLGYGEMLPPVMAAWAANIVFVCLSFFIFMNVE